MSEEAVTFDRETVEECMREAAERFFEGYAERSGVTVVVKWLRAPVRARKR